MCEKKTIFLPYEAMKYIYKQRRKKSNNKNTEQNCEWKQRN
jgi:hypothetical protein